MNEAEGQVEVGVVEEVIPRENDLEGQKMLDQALEEYEKKLEALEAKRAEHGQGEGADGGFNEKELEVVQAATSKEHGAEESQEEGAAGGPTPGPSRGSRTKEEQIDHIRRIKSMTKALTSLLPEWEDEDENRFQRACKSVEQELQEMRLDRLLGRGRGLSLKMEEKEDEEEEEDQEEGTSPD